MWSETEVLTRKKKKKKHRAPSLKTATPCSPLDVTVLKILPRWKNTLSSPRRSKTAFHIQSVHLRFVPLLLALRILITLHFEPRPNSSPSDPQRQKTSLAARLVANAKENHVSTCSSSIMPSQEQHFLLTVGFCFVFFFDSDASLKGEAPWIFLFPHSRIQDNRYLRHTGGIECRGLHSSARPALLLWMHIAIGRTKHLSLKEDYILYPKRWRWLCFILRIFPVCPQPST